MLKAVSVTRVYGLRPVLRGISLEAPAGQLTALFGANGAGKTTLLRTLAGISRPTGGTVTLNGIDLYRSGEAARRLIGLVGHQPMLYEDLTARENLRFFGRLYGLSDQNRIDALLERFGLLRRADEPIRVFSRGMLQRLALARATLHDPPLLLLDEPFSGLDQQAVADLENHLRTACDQGKAVLAITHDPLLGLRLADRVLVLAQGRIQLDAPANEIDAAVFVQHYPSQVGPAA